MTPELDRFIRAQNVQNVGAARLAMLANMQRTIDNALNNWNRPPFDPKQYLDAWNNATGQLGAY